MLPFLTQPEDYPEVQTSPSQTRTLRVLREEKVDLESQEVELRQKLADAKFRQKPATDFAPLSSIFPLRRDAFGQSKSASQQLKIYRQEWSTLQLRFNRVSNTTYTSELAQSLSKKQAKVKTLEHAQVDLKASVQALERKIQKLKSDSVNDSIVANMTALEAHVCLQREQVRTLEVAEEQRAQTSQEAEENLKRAKSRYRKMKQVARECGVWPRGGTFRGVSSEYVTLKVRLGRLERKGFFREEQQIQELTEEARRLHAFGKQLTLAVATREAEALTQRFEVPSQSARVSPNLPRKHLSKDKSVLLSQRDRY